MRTLVESLKRLYLKGSVAKSKIEDLALSERITAEEKNYIIKRKTTKNNKKQ